MKILAVNSIRVCGGGEKWLVRQASSWRERGHEPVIVCQPGSALARIVGAAGLRIAPCSMRNDVSLAAALRLASLFRRERPDVVLCCNERAFRLAAPASWIAPGARLIYRNGLTATFKNRSVNRLLFRRVDRMVVNAEPLREEMASYGWIAPERLLVIPNGVDTALYAEDAAAGARVREEVGTPPGRTVAAVIARIAEEKGLVEAVAALGELAPEHPEAELWIVGEGSLRARLEAQARGLGIGGRVRFLGFRQDVPDVLQGADLVIQASHREGLGNTLLEAMAAGRPVLASTVGGNSQVVAEGETGELVPPRDASALAAAWRGLLRDPERRRRYGAAGRRRVEERFPLDGETDRWCRLFEELISAGARRALAPAGADGATPPSPEALP